MKKLIISIAILFTLSLSSSGKNDDYRIDSLVINGLFTTGCFLLDEEKYSEAVPIFLAALKKCEIMRDESHSYHFCHAAVLEGLSQCNFELGNYKEAVCFSTMELDIQEVTRGKNHPYYASTLVNLALAYNQLGNYDEAMRLICIAHDIHLDVLGANHPTYASTLTVLAILYATQGKYRDAISTDQRAMYIYRKSGRKERYNYAQTLNNLALHYSRLGHYQTAVRLGSKALKIRKKLYGTENIRYSRSLGNIAEYNFFLENYAESIRVMTEAIDIIERNYGKELPEYAIRLSSLAFFFLHDRDTQSVARYSLIASELISTYVRKTFKLLTESERIFFWHQYDDWFKRDVPLLSYRRPHNSITSANGYNAALLSKGLLLSTEIEFRKLIQEEGDKTALELYDELRSLRTQINKLLERPISERPASMDSLERKTQGVEYALVERSKAYGDYTANMVISWEQVKAKLSDEDIAVEFVSFPVKTDSTMYMAYALRKGWEYPMAIPLFEENELEVARERKRMYGSDAVSRLVWKPLDEVMEGVQNVYFSPAGELHNIAIESLPSYQDGGLSIMSDHRNYFRLSSTRELVLRKDSSSWREAVVYGGLTYGMSIEEMIEADGKIPRRNDVARANSLCYTPRNGRLVDLLSEKEPLEYLEGTLKEAVAIKKALERRSVSTSLLTGMRGIETSFKDLSGRRKSVIHIGTHGFYDDAKPEYRHDIIQWMEVEVRQGSTEDETLMRSGLYLAGADSVRVHGIQAIPDSLDDGMLTALEIAQLDLRGLDLVVLSACRTGLGEITGEGVYGLQRGFKKAGAQTIMMSLWNVNDQATSDFMTAFFDSIKMDLGGHPTNKRQAFLNAQKYLRDNRWKYPDDPYCWAAFVMLD